MSVWKSSPDISLRTLFKLEPLDEVTLSHFRSCQRSGDTTTLTGADWQRLHVILIRRKVYSERKFRDDELVTEILTILQQHLSVDRCALFGRSYLPEDQKWQNAGDVLRLLDGLTDAVVYLWATEAEPLASVAQECLSALQVKIGQEKERLTLVRASERPASGAALLRPAVEMEDIQPQTLLLPTSASSEDSLVAGPKDPVETTRLSPLPDASADAL